MENNETGKNKMKTKPDQTPSCVCSCCKRSLPPSAFYADKKTGLPGNYCKECRKTASRNHRTAEKRLRPTGDYPVITRTEDPSLRGELLRHALRTVAESIERKNRKLKELDYTSWEE